MALKVATSLGSTASRSLLDSLSPVINGNGLLARSPRHRNVWFLPFCVTLALAVLLIAFPQPVVRLHCELGLRYDCTGSLVLQRAKHKLDSKKIKQSCTPASDGGKVVLVTGAAGVLPVHPMAMHWHAPAWL
jgi:hypothetical protein